MESIVGGRTGNYIPGNYREGANISTLIPGADRRVAIKSQGFPVCWSSTSL